METHAPGNAKAVAQADVVMAARVAARVDVGVVATAIAKDAAEARAVLVAPVHHKEVLCKATNR